MTASKTGPPHVLLLEDTPFDVRVFTRSVRRSEQPCRLTVATNGEEALRVLEDASNDPPDIAVVDLNMPRLSGLEFIEELRRRNWRYADLPVIVYTTSDLSADRQRCAVRGVSDYIVKTEPVEHVLSLVRQHLREQAA